MNVPVFNCIDSNNEEPKKWFIVQKDTFGV